MITILGGGIEGGVAPAPTPLLHHIQPIVVVVVVGVGVVIVGVACCYFACCIYVFYMEYIQFVT